MIFVGKCQLSFWRGQPSGLLLLGRGKDKKRRNSELPLKASVLDLSYHIGQRAWITAGEAGVSHLPELPDCERVDQLWQGDWLSCPLGPFGQRC